MSPFYLRMSKLRDIGNSLLMRCRVLRCLTAGSSLTFKRGEDEFQPRTQNKGLVHFKGCFRKFPKSSTSREIFSLRSRLLYEFQHREKRDSGRLAGLRCDQLGFWSKSQKELCLLLHEVIALSPSWNFYPLQGITNQAINFSQLDGLRRKASYIIGHFRVPKTLTFKMRLSAQPFLWKWVLFAWE